MKFEWPGELYHPCQKSFQKIQAMVRVASREVGDFSIRIQNASFWIHEKSVNPFKNDIIDIPFIGPGKP